MTMLISLPSPTFKLSGNLPINAALTDYNAKITWLSKLPQGYYVVL